MQGSEDQPPEEPTVCPSGKRCPKVKGGTVGNPGLSLMGMVRTIAARLDELAGEQDPRLEEQLRIFAGDLRNAEHRSVFDLSAAVERAAEKVQRLAADGDLPEGSYVVFDKDLDEARVVPDLESVGGEPDEIPILIPSGRTLPPEARASVVGGLVRLLEWGAHMRRVVGTSGQSPYDLMAATAMRHLFSGERGSSLDAA